MGHKNFAMDKIPLEAKDKSFDSNLEESPDERWEDEGGSLLDADESLQGDAYKRDT